MNATIQTLQQTPDYTCGMTDSILSARCRKQRKSLHWGVIGALLTAGGQQSGRRRRGRIQAGEGAKRGHMPWWQ